MIISITNADESIDVSPFSHMCFLNTEGENTEIPNRIGAKSTM